MAGISGLTNNIFYGLSSSGASSLFGSLKTDSTSALSSVVSDYSSIKNGSYGKLLKSYYGQNTASSATSSASKAADKTSKTSTAATQEAKQTLSDIKSASGKLDSAASKLTSTGTDSLFTKKDITNDDGTVTNDYDKDAIYSAVNSFAKSYNDTLDAADKSSNQNITGVASNMTSLTSTMKNALSKIGVSVGTDGKLSVDEDALKSADVKSIKSLMNGNTSYAKQIENFAGKLTNASTNQLTSLSGSFYTSNGYYSSALASAGTSYSSYF